MTWAAVLTLGLLAGTIGGVIGFGSSILLMPALVVAFGAKEAVPIMAIAALMANAGRVAVWWRDNDWKLNAVYCLTAVPASAVGARLLVALDARVVEGALGAFFLTMIPMRRWLVARGLRIGLPGMALVGAGIGFLSGMVASTGPINTPFFLAYGLIKGGFLATEAVGSMAISLTKAVVFQSFGALPVEVIVRGLIVGSSLMLGAWAAKSIVLGMDPARFRIILEVMMAVSGGFMLWSAFM